MAIEVGSSKGVDEGILVSPPLVTLPSVFLDDMRYPTTDLGVHSWIAHGLFTFIACKFDRGK